ncbi:HIT domain-containing protein [Gammaproteobacteria bacterium AS21]
MNKLEVGFELDRQLAADSIVLGDFPLCQLLLINDRQYPWFVLVPRRAGISELYHLSDSDRVQMMVESCDLSAALADGYAASKMNVAAIGNVVNQLHVHHVVRFESDASWPAPIWGKFPAKAYTSVEIEAIDKKVKSLLETTLLSAGHEST